MRAGDITTNHIPVAEVDRAVSECLAEMTGKCIDNMIAVEHGLYRGVITRRQCTACDDLTMTVGEVIEDIPTIQADAHILEAIELLADHERPFVVVTDAHNHYLGSISRTEAIHAMAVVCNTAHMGAVIELEMLPEDYSITEIARLVEDNHCKLITLFSYPDVATGLLRVQIRTNCNDATPILQSFERFGYQVVATYNPQGRIDERAEQRLRELMYYLEM